MNPTTARDRRREPPQFLIMFPRLRSRASAIHAQKVLIRALKSTQAFTLSSREGVESGRACVLNAKGARKLVRALEKFLEEAA